MTPFVAVVGGTLDAGRIRGWRQAAVAVPLTYLDALHRAGAEEAILSPVELDVEAAAARLARFDALLLVGGGDVAPARYAEEARPEVSGVEPTRDSFELAVLRAALDREMPVLAVCRGVQVLNVALGGGLVQHLPDGPHDLAHRSGDGREGVLHPVEVAVGSRLGDVTGPGPFEVFSHHHQALGRLGAGLTLTAWAKDGVAEAVEHERGWVVGIQWHAEATAATDARQQAIFDRFVDQARPA